MEFVSCLLVSCQGSRCILSLSQDKHNWKEAWSPFSSYRQACALLTRPSLLLLWNRGVANPYPCELFASVSGYMHSSCQCHTFYSTSRDDVAAGHLRHRRLVHDRGYRLRHIRHAGCVPAPKQKAPVVSHGVGERVGGWWLSWPGPCRLRSVRTALRRC